MRIEVGDDDLIVRADLGPQSSTDIKTLPYPGFPTDIQSPFMAYLTTVEGSSTVIETVSCMWLSLIRWGQLLKLPAIRQ